jgi:hypothetical protein
MEKPATRASPEDGGNSVGSILIVVGLARAVGAEQSNDLTTVHR